MGRIASPNSPSGSVIEAVGSQGLPKICFVFVSMSVFEQVRETSTCLPFPISSEVCASRSLKCFWSVSRRAEQKLLKAFGPRLGKSSCNRQLRLWDVCSACKRDGTKIAFGTQITSVFFHSWWLHMEDCYLRTSSFVPFCMHLAINSQCLWNFLAVIRLHIWWFGCLNSTDVVLEQTLMKQKSHGKLTNHSIFGGLYRVSWHTNAWLLTSLSIMSDSPNSNSIVIVDYELCIVSKSIPWFLPMIHRSTFTYHDALCHALCQDVIRL